MWEVVRCIALIAAIACVARPLAAEPVVRIGLLKFGTVSWELDVIAHHGLDREAGIHIEPVELAGTPATQIALQSGRVDVIVADYFWVSRQRASGADWTFVPFSTAIGGLLVPAASPIRSLADLTGKRLAIAGSPLDKSWLILRALGQRRYGIDLETACATSFGAPPLVDAQLAEGRADAALTYWPFAARLEATGMRPVLSVGKAMLELGVASAVPLVGYVVSEHWADDHRTLLDGFLSASGRARDILGVSDAEWQRIAPLTRARDAAELARLRDAFRAGIPRRWGDAERADAARLYDLLAEIGGTALVGPSRRLEPGTFLASVRY